MAEQMLLCVPRKTVPEFLGFIESHLLLWQRADHLSFLRGTATAVPRSQAETDEAWKQLATYCLVTNGRGGYLIYERPTHTGDSRLHGREAVGVGGHVEECDLTNATSSHAATLIEVIAAAARRELVEEISPGMAALQGLELLGFVQHDDTPVARVHLGAVFLVRVDPEQLKFSDELLRPEFVTLDVLQSHLPNMEYWSEIMTLWLVGASRRNLPCLLRHQSTGAVVETQAGNTP